LHRVERLDRLERVTDLLLVLLDTSVPLSLRAIADRVPGYPDSPSARRQAFERDKRLLRDEGVPIEVVPIGGEEQLGYRVDPDRYYLRDLRLTPEEQAALNLAVAGVHLGDPSGHEALSKLGVVGDLPGHPMAGSLTVELPTLADLPALPGLYDALRASATVTLHHRGELRHVDPAGLRFRGGHWYLVGYDRDRGAPRTFRVDRIDADLESGPPGSAVLPEGFDPDAAIVLRPWRFGADDEVVVDVLVDAAAAGGVVAELGPDAVVETRSNGSVVVRLTVTDQEAFVTWVLGLLDHGEVLAPGEVRGRVRDRLVELARVAPEPG